MSETGEDQDPALAPLHEWRIPTLVEGEHAVLEANPGGITVVVGPNGSGKSALALWLDKEIGESHPPVRRVLAHRRIWLEAPGPDITLNRRNDLTRNMRVWDRDDNSRWKDVADAARSSVALFDLLGRINERNNRVSSLVDGGMPTDEIKRTIEPSPLDRINSILSSSSIDVQLVLTATSSFDAVTDGDPYPMSEMSDGEKSAVLLAAEVLTAPYSSVVIVDEPERHLHRSISAGLVHAVAAERTDCHFVVLTHDLDLASKLSEDPTTRTMVLSRCRWSNQKVVGWEINSIESRTDLPDSVRRAILGGRKRILFIEGEANGLDFQLYQVLYPGWSLQAVGSCEEVIRSVKGLVSSDQFHWIECCGVVDGDRRSPEEASLLSDSHILCLGVCEVENLYFSEPVLNAVSIAQSEHLGKDADALFENAIQSALTALKSEATRRHLAAVAAHTKMRRDILAELPTRNAVEDGEATITISVASSFEEEFERITTLLDAQDYETIVKEFTIRDSSVRTRAVGALGLQNVDDYGSIARRAIGHDPLLLESTRKLAGALPIRAAT